MKTSQIPGPKQLPNRIWRKEDGLAMKESGAVELVDPEWPDVLYEGNDSRHEGFAKDENAEPNEDLIKALGFLHAEGREIGW